MLRDARVSVRDAFARARANVSERDSPQLCGGRFLEFSWIFQRDKRPREYRPGSERNLVSERSELLINNWSAFLPGDEAKNSIEATKSRILCNSSRCRRERAAERISLSPLFPYFTVFWILRVQKNRSIPIFANSRAELSPVLGARGLARDRARAMWRMHAAHTVDSCYANA